MNSLHPELWQSWLFLEVAVVYRQRTACQSVIPWPASLASPGNLLEMHILKAPLWASQMVLVVKNPPANAGDIRDEGSVPRLGRSPGGGHSNPLQYSCLENPMDRAAWWSTVLGSHRAGHDWSYLACMHASPISRPTETETLETSHLCLQCPSNDSDAHSAWNFWYKLTRLGFCMHVYRSPYLCSW